MYLPVICNNPKCGSVWFTNSFTGGNASFRNAVIIGNMIGPCPACGGVGAVADTCISDFEARFVNPSQEKAIFDALRQLEKLIAGGAKPEEVSEAIEKSSVLRDVLGKYAPKDWNELASLVSIVSVLIGFVCYFSNCNQSTQAPVPVQIVVPSELTEAVKEISAKLRTSNDPVKPPHMLEQRTDRQSEKQPGIKTDW